MPGTNYFNLPKKAEILTAQIQNDIPCIWVFFDRDEDKVNRAFELYETGRIIYDAEHLELKYINTVQFKNGLVYHVFERLSN